MGSTYKSFDCVPDVTVNAFVRRWELFRQLNYELVAVVSFGQFVVVVCEKLSEFSDHWILENKTFDQWDATLKIDLFVSERTTVVAVANVPGDFCMANRFDVELYTWQGFKASNLCGWDIEFTLERKLLFARHVHCADNEPSRLISGTFIVQLDLETFELHGARFSTDSPKCQQLFKSRADKLFTESPPKALNPFVDYVFLADITLITRW